MTPRPRTIAELRRDARGLGAPWQRVLPPRLAALRALEQRLEFRFDMHLISIHREHLRAWERRTSRREMARYAIETRRLRVVLEGEMSWL